MITCIQDRNTGEVVGLLEDNILYVNSFTIPIPVSSARWDMVLPSGVLIQSPIPEKMWHVYPHKTVGI